ncbi:MAG: PLP-dependent aspartate aminotransferase family protein, partial [Bacteroidota bacterium]|nr:PLP-dependent aspartate aminotransferase family protein [Bacteroidota bacterium]
MPDKNFHFNGFGSTAIHAGHTQDANYAHQVPIYASSTFVYDNAEQGMNRFSGKEEGFIYSRWGNPTFREAEEKINALETYSLPIETHAILHASGMAAITTLMLSNLKSGDKVVSHFSLYGGSDDLLQTVLPALGIESIIVDLTNLEIAEAVLKKNKNIKMLYLETPANPTIQCVDLEQLSKLAKQYGILVACDNTFATPYLQQPFKYDIDFIVHSTTKFLNGHGSAIGGVLLGRDVEFMKTKVTKTHRLLGGNANPFDAFLLIQGIKTLELRMIRHCHNASEVANFLNHHTKVARVNYAGLSTHPSYEIATKQMKHPGAMLSFELKDGLQGGISFMNKLKMCTRTVSLGTVDSLLSHPASMTHQSVSAEHREKYNITEGLIRMSVGIEDLQDIINDLEQA